MNDRAASEAIQQMLSGFWISHALAAAAELGLADRLAAGGKRCEVLASEVGVDSGALRRLLRALAGVGVFAERPDGEFELTPMADRLRGDQPGSLRAWARMMCRPWHRELWGGLLTSLRTGAPALVQQSQGRLFEYLTANEVEGAIFDEAMTSVSVDEIAAVMNAYDFAPFRSIVDVAGGHGSLLCAVLRSNPEARGLILDLPQVIEGARQALLAEGLGSRCELVPGDFFERVPEGADLYLLKHIVHDWGDADAVRILRNIRAAMSPGSRLLILEAVIEPGNAPSFGKLLDLEMLLIGGKERDEAEYRALLHAADLKLARVVPTPSPVSVIEAQTV